MNSNWHVYMIQTISGKLYTGITTNLERRFAEHLSSKKGAKFFQTSKPKKIVFQESHPSRSSALKREWQIKKMNRADKIKLF